jgi:hypothetical protein
LIQWHDKDKPTARVPAARSSSNDVASGPACQGTDPIDVVLPLEFHQFFNAIRRTLERAAAGEANRTSLSMR